MKIRTGFVSNSSSSSFIIRIVDDSDKEPCACCGRGYENNALEMLNAMAGSYDCSEFIPILDACNESDWLTKWVNENPDKINGDIEDIYYGDISYHNHARSEFLDKCESIEIIEDMG